MKHVLDLEWQQKMAFETILDGHKIQLDAGIESGGDDLGPRPKRFLLLALAGCTGMDVISILKKMRVEPDSFHVIVDADVTDDDPKRYEKMKVIYQFKGKNLPIEKIEKTVQLSEEKYCGISATLKEAVQLSSEIRIL